MPIIKSAVKRAKQTTKRREQNIVTKQAVKAASKAFVAQPTAKTLSAAQSAIDTAVKKNVLHKNTAARRKARLATIAKDAGVKLPAKKAAAKSTPSTAAKKPAAKTTTATKKTTTQSAATKKTTAAKKPAAKTTATKSTAKKS